MLHWCYLSSYVQNLPQGSPQRFRRRLPHAFLPDLRNAQEKHLQWHFLSRKHNIAERIPGPRFPQNFRNITTLFAILVSLKQVLWYR